MVVQDRDPLAILMMPSPNETAEEKSRRLEEERLQQTKNAEIEEMLRVERISLANKKFVRILLVGQSESGKSTVLKNFQLAWSPRAFRAERATWTRIIYLNIVRAINVICNVLSIELDRSNGNTTTSESGHSNRTPSLASLSIQSQSQSQSPPQSLSQPLFQPQSQSASASGSNTHTHALRPATSSANIPLLTEYHQDLIHRLASLKDLELQLQNQLASGSSTCPHHHQEQQPQSQSTKEFYVLSNKESIWRRTWTVRRTSFGEVEGPERSERVEWGDRGSNRSGNSNSNVDREEEEERTQVQDNKNVMARLMENLPDMKKLWADERTKGVLAVRKPKLDDSAPFYLDHLDRIIAMGYVPSDDDIVRARLRTIGVQEHFLTHEHKIEIGLGREVSRDWIIYDVGGARSQREAWVPFFEHMHAIIFLAPVNCFNQKLAEDPRVNRLEDSFHLYQKIISSPLLSQIPVILFLNKMDLLAHNIENGIQLHRYVTSYGDRPNTVDSIVDYFQKKFRDLCRQHSPSPRRFYAYRTSAIDISSTTVTLNIVRDGILKSQLRNAELL